MSDIAKISLLGDDLLGGIDYNIFSGAGWRVVIEEVEGGSDFKNWSDRAPFLEKGVTGQILILVIFGLILAIFPL